MDSLGLTTPVQHDFTDPTVERDIERLREWLINLPLMNVVETVRLVLGALTALNEQKLDDEQRFLFLEIYRTTVLRLFQTLDPLHLRQLALPKAQRQQAMAGVAALFLDLAGGYKLIIRKCYESGQSASALCGQALNRALEQLSYALLDSYRFYREINPLIITELHVLYRLARHHGHLAVRFGSVENHPAATTAQLYHASMLLTLTEPERLAEGEVGLLFEVLMQQALRCRIIQGNSWEGRGEGLFLIDLCSRDLPVPCISLRSPVTAREPFLLDARDALRAMQTQLEQTPVKVRQQSPEALLLRRLLPAVNKARQRREQRQSDSRHVGVLTGLQAVHGWLRAQRHADAAGVAKPVRCQMLDRSDNGMKLAWHEGGAGDIRVGELLGIVTGDAAAAVLQPAVVRSIRVYREGGLEAGVELLQGGFGAVTCSVPDVAGLDAVSALFMPADESQQLAATLLVPKGVYATGRGMLIDVGGREIRVRCGRRVFDGPLFDRFEFAAQ